jgi:hypothetical protein
MVLTKFTANGFAKRAVGAKQFDFLKAKVELLFYVN